MSNAMDTSLISIFLLVVFLKSRLCPTARCYAERGIATAKSPVRLSVTLRYPDRIRWNSSKIISRLVSLGCSLSADPNITRYRGTP